MHARRALARRRFERAAEGCRKRRAGRPGRGRPPLARQARASERRFISSCVISRCSVFSALPGSDM